MTSPGEQRKRGRQPLVPGVHTIPLTIRVVPAMQEALRRQAQAEGTTVSVISRRALQESLDRNARGRGPAEKLLEMPGS